jgi:fatty-acyl-CoA synthase
MMRSIEDRRSALSARFSPWKPLSLHAALDEACRRYGTSPFVITEDRTWTYSDIVAWSERLGKGLQRKGVGVGDKVGIILGNYPEFVALKFAIARIGAVAVPINILNRRDELRYLLRQSDTVLLVTMDSFRGNDYLEALDQIAPGWARHGGGDTFPMLREIVVFPTGEKLPRVGVETFGMLDLELGADTAFPTVDPASLCDIIYTSGTTGSPKGVMLSHDMLTRTAFGAAYARAFEERHRILFSLPMFHVFGYVEGLLAVLWVGGAIIPQLRFDADDTLAAIERHRASDALLIPAMSLALIDAAPQRKQGTSTLHFALASGGRAPERLWGQIHDVLGVQEITTGYGMTETTATTMLTAPDDPMERLLTSNGRFRDVGPVGDPAISGRLVDYRVVNPETGVELPAGEVGELVAKGPGVTRGYYNKPDATAAAFTEDGWLRTGDLAKIDDEGYMSLVGRCKESYRCGGEQVLPTEVEDLLTSDPAVLQAHVVPVPDERMGEVGAAFIVPRRGATVDVDRLRELTSTRLARFKVPRHFLVVEEGEIPTTASGRAQKFLLTKRAAELLNLS